MGDEPQGEPGVPPTNYQDVQPTRPGLITDIKDYFTAPLHWSGGEWAVFGGVLVGIGAAHHYDTQVRTHFVTGSSVSSGPKDVQDALPMVAVLGATWVYAGLTNSSDGHTETWNMVEATGLSSVTAYALKFAAGRAGPDKTSNANEWGKGSGSFPSWHTTAAFAVGTVLAESGNDEYRWVRRVLGYGLGTFTAYERLKHNAHWLSDVVAGAALGAASAHFVLVRNDRARDTASHLSVEPSPGGVMLTYSTTLP